MNCEIFTFNPLGVNCCLMWDEQTRQAAIIDCSARTESEFAQIERAIEGNHLLLEMALQTHMHFDHVYGLPRLYERFGIAPSCHAAEMPIYQMAPQMASHIRFPIEGTLPAPSSFLNDGQEIQLGSITICAIHTPGHTPGSLCFFLPETKQLFSGDTLFCESIGRTDLPGGNFEDLKNSITERLFTLPEETRVLPGHGGVTQIGWEAQNNPYV